MTEIGEWIKILGGFAGLVALVWRILDEFGAYLRISIEVRGPQNGWITALTTVDNRNIRAKNLSHAFLLVGPESEDPIETGKRIASSKDQNIPLVYTEDLQQLQFEQPVYTDERAFIPLNFYCSENVDIGDETLSYRAPIRVREFQEGQAYSIRFFLFSKHRLHRCTHDCFINQELPTGGD